MNLSTVSWRRGVLAALPLLACALVAPPARAFPPAPAYTIYGLVRDQVGATLAVDGAEIILLKVKGSVLDNGYFVPDLRCRYSRWFR
jgi:hypothetical protein